MDLDQILEEVKKRKDEVDLPNIHSSDESDNEFGFLCKILKLKEIDDLEKRLKKLKDNA